MIKVKTLFHGWKEITKERAIEWAQNIWQGSVALTEEKKLECINSRLEGIQFTKDDLRRIRI